MIDRYMSILNPCLSCGACCAFYRASFHWSEANDAIGGTVPVEMTSDLNEFRRVMKGTDQKNPRCIALEGEIGVNVRCKIYDLRPSICRAFPVSWENRVPDDMCERARVAWGLSALDPDLTRLDKFPRAA